MNNNTLSSKKLILFMSTSNIFIVNLIGLSRLFNKFTNNAWIVVFLIFLSNLILFIPFKGLPKGINLLKKIKNNKFIKLLILIYLLFSITLNTLIVSFTINKFFYFNSSVLITCLVILITGLIISKESLNKIITINIVFFIMIIPFYLIPFTHIEERDFSLLLPIYLKSLDLIYAFPLLMFPLEHLIHGIFCDQMEKGFDKKSIILSFLFEGLYIFLIMIDAQTLIGANFYVDMEYPGVFRWLIYQGNKFIENYDIFLLIIIIVTYIFKLSFYLFALRNILFKKINIKTYSFLFIIIFILISLIYSINNKLNIISNIYLYSSHFILLSLYCYFTYISHKVSKTKETKYYG